jgi:hypothetical protein
LTVRRVWRVVVYGWPLALLGVIAAAVAGRIGPLQRLQAYLVAHADVVRWLSLLALNLAAVGVLLLLVVYFLMRTENEDQVGATAVELLPVDRRRRLPRSRARRDLNMEAWAEELATGPVDPSSVRGLLTALRRTLQLMPLEQRRLIVMMLGGLCFVSGASSFVFLVGPPFVKLLVLAALLYGTGWVLWHVWHAEGVMRRG